MHFNNYINHREMQPFDEISLYSGWLTCRSRLTASHMPERVMRQFGYTQTILRDHVVSAHPALTYRQMDAMFDDYEIHLVSEEAQSNTDKSDWSYVDEYIRWFFRVPHSYMVHAAPEDPPRLSHQEILKEE
ncbi:uncharacterized protein LOC127095239 [Lathyrus oleraceus]|uniref:uncharacterized protein LOC127095239 n=1 Tax=Pisum sativum TaxID=3888 RepID=UPI0021D308D4|nr:uncharacterized protein LOC127095239 [Pisum sativum]